MYLFYMNYFGSYNLKYFLLIVKNKISKITNITMKKIITDFAKTLFNFLFKRNFLYKAIQKCK